MSVRLGGFFLQSKASSQNEFKEIFIWKYKLFAIQNHPLLDTSRSLMSHKLHLQLNPLHSVRVNVSTSHLLQVEDEQENHVKTVASLWRKHVSSDFYELPSSPFSQMYVQSTTEGPAREEILVPANLNKSSTKLPPRRTNCSIPYYSAGIVLGLEQWLEQVTSSI